MNLSNNSKESNSLSRSQFKNEWEPRGKLSGSRGVKARTPPPGLFSVSFGGTTRKLTFLRVFFPSLHISEWQNARDFAAWQNSSYF